MAVVGETTVDYLQISGSPALLGAGITELLHTLEPDLRKDIALKESLAMKFDGVIMSMVDKAIDKPLYVVAAIDQLRLNVKADVSDTLKHKINNLGKKDDAVWFIVSPSLGGRPVLRNIRPIGNNPSKFGNFMISSYFEVMIKLWLQGLPQDGSTHVKYQVTLEYNDMDYPERPDEFCYVLQFYKSPSSTPFSDLYFVMNKMAYDLNAYVSSESEVLGLDDLLKGLKLSFDDQKGSADSSTVQPDSQELLKGGKGFESGNHPIQPSYSKSSVQVFGGESVTDQTAKCEPTNMIILQSTQEIQLKDLVFEELDNTLLGSVGEVKAEIESDRFNAAACVCTGELEKSFATERDFVSQNTPCNSSQSLDKGQWDSCLARNVFAFSKKTEDKNCTSEKRTLMKWMKRSSDKSSHTATQAAVKTYRAIANKVADHRKTSYSNNFVQGSGGSVSDHEQISLQTAKREPLDGRMLQRTQETQMTDLIFEELDNALLDSMRKDKAEIESARLDAAASICFGELEKNGAIESDSINIADSLLMKDSFPHSLDKVETYSSLPKNVFAFTKKTEEKNNSRNEKRSPNTWIKRLCQKSSHTNKQAAIKNGRSIVNKMTENRKTVTKDFREMMDNMEESSFLTINESASKSVVFGLKPNEGSLADVRVSNVSNHSGPSRGSQVIRENLSEVSSARDTGSANAICVFDTDITWLDGTRKPPPSCFQLLNALSIEQGRDKIDDETSFCDPAILNELIATKNIMNNFSQGEKRRARARANIFEAIDNKLFCNRSGMKMANLDSDFQFMFTDPKDSEGNALLGPNDLLFFADVCAGPGGLSDYILWRKGWRAKGIGFTSKSFNDFKLNNFVDGPPGNFEPYYGYHEDGSISRSKNVDGLYKRVMAMTHCVGVHVMVSEGGLSVQGKENVKEIMSKRLILGKCLTALRIVRVGGHFITNVFDLFTPFSAGLIYLMHCCFEQITIHKPFASRPANSERFLICKGRKNNVDGVVKYLNHVNSTLAKLRGSDKDVRHIFNFQTLSNKQSPFFKYLYESNNRLATAQIAQIKKLISFHNDPSKVEEKQELMQKLCHEMWNIPQNAERECSLREPKQVSSLLLGDNLDRYSVKITDLELKKVEKQLKSPFNWYCCVVGNSSDDPVTKPTLFLSLGKAGLFKWESDAWISHKSNFRLPNNSIVLGEVILGQDVISKEHVEIFHIIDAAFLGGQDIRALPAEQRLSQCVTFARALRQKDNLIFASHLWLLSDLNTVLKKLIILVDKSGTPCLHYMFEHFTFIKPCGLLCIPRSKADLKPDRPKTKTKPKFVNRTVQRCSREQMSYSGVPTDFVYSVKNLFQWKWEGLQFHWRESQCRDPRAVELGDAVSLFCLEDSWSGFRYLPVQVCGSDNFSDVENEN